MSTVLNSKPTILVAMPTTDRTMFHSFGGSVETAVKGAFSGKCDLDTQTFIGSNAQAPSVCTPLCANAGGWVGTWTNIAPPAWPGYSACGCNTCVADTPLPPNATETLALARKGPAVHRYSRN
jgi:thiamine pyridinylase